MKGTETLKTQHLRQGHIEWGPEYVIRVNRYKTGCYTSPLGICAIRHESRVTIITTVHSGKKHEVYIKGIITPMSIAKRCCKLLKQLNQN